MEECELNLENVKRERDILSQELQTAKEKIHSLESVVNTIGSDESSPAYNHQVQSLTKQVIQLTTLIILWLYIFIARTLV